MLKVAPFWKSSKKRTKRDHWVTRVQFDDVDLHEEDDSDTEFEDQNKELVGGSCRKFGEQIKESVSQHLLEDDENEIDAELSEIAQVAEERANREDTESEDEPSIKCRKLDNEREESVPHAASKDNDSATVIVP